jgi:hypothetical protein
MKALATSYYAIGTKVWYRRGGDSAHDLRGVVEDITIGAPPVTYCVRLESRERVWAVFSELLPR